VRELGFVIYDRHRWGALVKTVGEAPCAGATRKGTQFWGVGAKILGTGGGSSLMSCRRGSPRCRQRRGSVGGRRSGLRFWGGNGR
jgi:hypothetical protein